MSVGVLDHHITIFVHIIVNSHYRTGQWMITGVFGPSTPHPANLNGNSILVLISEYLRISLLSLV